MNEFGLLCKELRRKGLTLPEIARITGRPKNSIYFHIRSIPLSPAHQQAIRRASGERARAIAKSRKGKGLHPFREFSEWTPEYVLLVAHLSFDGEIIRGRCSYNNRSEVLIRRVETLMKNVYDFEPKRYKDLVSGVIRIGYFNVALSAYLQEKSKLLFESVEQARPALKREFLRAFFDDEGCMDYRIKTNARRIRGYQKDPSVLMTVQNLLKDFAIESQIQAPNEVVISGKENLIGFKREIDFSAGVRINGNRSNSVWKEDLEKRILLERAIESFVS